VIGEDIVHAHGNMWTNMNKALLGEPGGETFLYRNLPVKIFLKEILAGEVDLILDEKVLAFQP